jgi:hypothetical protein
MVGPITAAYEKEPSKEPGDLNKLEPNRQVRERPMCFRLCWILSLLVLAGCGGGSEPTGVPPESAVAFTLDGQRYGYCYDVAEANRCAEKYCAEGSGQACETLFRSAERGYYALALGQLGWGVGFSPDDKDLAGQRAMNQCQQQTQGCREVESWQADGIQ